MGRHLIAAALGALFCASGIAQSTAAESSPNFLFIIADDMGCHDCGPYGNQQIRTPHLDVPGVASVTQLLHNPQIPRHRPNYREVAAGRAPAAEVGN